MERLLDALAHEIAWESIRIAVALGISAEDAWREVTTAASVAISARLDAYLPQVIDAVDREAFAASVTNDLAHLDEIAQW